MQNTFTDWFHSSEYITILNIYSVAPSYGIDCCKQNKEQLSELKFSCIYKFAACLALNLLASYIKTKNKQKKIYPIISGICKTTCISRLTPAEMIAGLIFL